jgi:hypothetical protein
MYTRTDRISRDTAENLAVEALTFLAEAPETLGGFLGATGLGPETLREAAAAPGFFAAVLEYLMGDEALLLVFTERRRIRPTMIAAARHALDPVAER